MSRDMSDAHERYEERQNKYYAKRGRIRDAGLNADELESASERYRRAEREIKTMEYYQSVVDDYERNPDPKWEDFD